MERGVPRARDFRNDFSSGVIAEEFLARGADELTRSALKTGLNAFIPNGGGVMRRPGSMRSAATSSAFAGREFDFEMPDGSIRRMIFFATGCRIYQTDGTLEETLSGPWAAGDVYTMQMVKSPVSSETALYIASQSFWPRVISWDGSSWSIANFAFRSATSGRRASLFSRFTNDPITLSLPAYTGTSLTATFSDDVLTSDHVGVRFMYVNSQVEITAVTNATTATVDIIDELYPTVQLGVADSSVFAVGEEVAGDVTAVRGQVVALGSAEDANYVQVLLTDSYTGFRVASGSDPGEKLLGPNGSQEITSTVTVATPAATNQWLEEVISAERGYPGAITVHKGRLMLAGFPLLGDFFAASATGAPTDFDLGGGSDGDAIFEALGEDPDAQINHLISMEDLIILTERACWYVPEGAGGAFTPRLIQTVGIQPISNDGASAVPAIKTPEGAVFVDNNDRLLALSGTGDARRSYGQPQDLTQLGYDHVVAPKQIFYSTAVGGRKERVLGCLNDDGSAAVFIYRRGAQQGGWIPWARASGDEWHSFSSFNGTLYCVGQSGTNVFLEEMSFSAVLDAEADDGDGVAAEACYMLLNSQVIGAVTLDGSGNVPAATLGALDAIDKIGHDFAVTIEPAPYVNPAAGRQRIRIGLARLDVISTGTFRAEGKLCQGYTAASDLELPAPVVSRDYKVSGKGSGYGKTMTIEQRIGEGAPFHLRSLTMEINVHG